jgi:hypothetical protein
VKDVLAIGKPSSPQKRTSSTINIFLHFFLFLWGHFCPPRSGSSSSRPKLLRIHEDPDPHQQHHWGLSVSCLFCELYCRMRCTQSILATHTNTPDKPDIFQLTLTQVQYYRFMVLSWQQHHSVCFS